MEKGWEVNLPLSIYEALGSIYNALPIYICIYIHNVDLISQDIDKMTVYVSDIVPAFYD